MTAASWRDRITIHPAAAMFPMMPADELLTLGEDIKKNGLHQKLTFRAEHRRSQQQAGSRLDVIRQLRAGKLPLLDGRNRLAAMELVGILDDEAFEKMFREAAICWGEDDAEEFVVSVNIRRRHLTAEKKRDLIGKLVKAKPERSDNATAKMIGASGKTVTSVRRDLEATSEIPKLDKTVGADGKARPSAKPKPQDKEAQLRAMREQQAAAPVHPLLTETDHAAKAEENKRETLLRVTEAAFSGTAAWAVPSFVEDVRSRIKDQKFRTLLIQRLRLEQFPENVDALEAGVVALKRLLKELLRPIGDAALSPVEAAP
jgi:hypothetical protein